ncbi:hypothetical protein Phum_PHUM512130 [Pediculus humanus corporis]|uniref:Uncharacterized protein n=1 Tax=Pediculus humanus subsp. corporis TaxID=121224 RepID=E0VYA4_PEDHC|nr:uncharacterized protein Phum_PHUM512130 [Pediculus humanus corporis]EEB18360.1 hypothetical protein Phum_PHUM512130 [Pediculus humanus corporis]
MSVMSGDEENKKKVDDVGGVDVRDDDGFFSTNNPTLAKKTFGKKNHRKNKIPENVLTKIWDEINFAEYLLLKYLEEIMENYGKTEESDKRLTLRDLSDLIRREIKHLNKVKKSRVVSVSGNFVTFQSDDGEFLVTLVPGEELHKNFQNIFSLSNVKPRFAKPVQSRENCYRTSMTSSTSTSPSTESIYYDALCDIKSDINLLTTRHHFQFKLVKKTKQGQSGAVNRSEGSGMRMFINVTEHNQPIRIGLRRLFLAPFLLSFVVIACINQIFLCFLMCSFFFYFQEVVLLSFVNVLVNGRKKI